MHANLPADLRWAGEGSDPAADAVELLRAMGGDAGALDALTGFAGLERLLVWVAARDIAASTPAGVRIGATAERQTSWLRRVQGPGQLSDILDLITPRVERHRSMPGVFGDRARRSRLLEELWEWGRAWQRRVEAGGVRLWAAGPIEEDVRSIAAWIGVIVDEPAVDEPAVDGPDPRPRLTLADLGDHVYRVRIRAPLHLAFPGGDVPGAVDADVAADPDADTDSGSGREGSIELADATGAHGAARGPIHVDASSQSIIVQVAGHSRRFDAPAILHVCDLGQVRVSPPDAWVRGWGDILVWFRADPARLP
ncbi:hypothetical protein [uncultured Corynebacterium sp.]|uniref:hypothetical protein n=1 Tax=uncultured Corynebacterium sp. TaxID=159447 RepID=UPI0025FE4622|nr:hypothetical protein [uncultured Corynebacterium sp.]